MPSIRLRSLSECMVFFDFDNTITPFDVLDDIIKRFAADRNWVAFERDWKARKIGSKECLIGQLKSVRVKRKALLRYLSTVKLDPHFKHLLAMLKRDGVKPIILSDSFSFILKYVLRNNGITGIKIYSNRIRLHKTRLIPSFPYFNKRCPLCANCKTKHLRKNSVQNKIIVYIGDGLSDICPAQHADLVFAKGSLLNHFRQKKMLCMAFDKLSDIYSYFRGLDL